MIMFAVHTIDTVDWSVINVESFNVLVGMIKLSSMRILGFVRIGFINMQNRRSEVAVDFVFSLRTPPRSQSDAALLPLEENIFGVGGHKFFAARTNAWPGLGGMILQGHEKVSSKVDLVE